MDYRRHYNNLISAAKSRQLDPGIYVERHHIIPDFFFKERSRKGPSGHLPGNPDDPSNIAKLTAREHMVAHMLLAKIYRGTHYQWPCEAALITFASIRDTAHPRQSAMRLTSRQFETARSIGIRGISKMRKGKMPCVDSEGNSVGSHPTDHPKVLSGEWVHHSKGMVLVKVDGAVSRVTSEEYRANKDLYSLAVGFKGQSGDKNYNFKEFGSELSAAYLDLCEKALMFHEGVHYLQRKDAVNAMKQLGQSIGQTFSEALMDRKMGGLEGVVEALAAKTGLNVKKLGKSKIFRTGKKIDKDHEN